FMAIDDHGASGAVFVADADGGPRVTLTEFADGYPVYLSWAPDGRAVAMLVAQRETQNLLLADASGRGDPRPIAAGLPLYSSWGADRRALLGPAGGGGLGGAAG